MNSALYVSAWIKDVQGRGNLLKSTEKILGPVKIPGFCFTPACDGGPERRGVQDGMRFPI